MALIALSLLFLQTAVMAQEEKKAFVISEGPYIQNVTETEFTVVWTSSADATAWVEIAPDDDSHFYERERPKYYESKAGKRNVGCLHRVRVGGLDPGTAYRYRILQQEVVYPEGSRMQPGKIAASAVYGREPYRVTTVDPGAKQASFLTVNDIHARDSIFTLLIRDVPKENYDFVFFNGDMVSSVPSEEHIFDGFLRSAGKLFASTIPFYMVRGNHEGRGRFSDNFMDYFPTPNGLPYYTFRRGPVFFIVLDGGEDKPDSDIEYSGLADFDAYRREEAAWLAGVVDSREFREAPVKIVMLHMPPGERLWHGPQMAAELFGPLLNGKGIDLMLSGHLHREVYIPALSDDFDFPIYVNSNNTAVRVDVGANNAIRLRVLDTGGAVKKELNF